MSDSSATHQSSQQADSTAGERLYIVFGTTGEYSDRTEWPVRAFVSLEKAREWADAAKRRFHELRGGRPRSRLSCLMTTRLAAQNEYDPGHAWDPYTGVDWFVSDDAIPLDRSGEQ